jgi:hypothetical protein
VTIDQGLKDADKCDDAPSKTATYLEAVAGDHGVHVPPAPEWWLSEDIRLNYGTSEQDQGVAGGSNQLAVRPRASKGCKLSSDVIKVELFVCTPFVTPLLGPSSPFAFPFQPKFVAASKVGEDGVAGGDPFLHFLPPWDASPPPGSPLGGDDPQAPGHRCLIARCYPEGPIPDSKSFNVPDDPHSAQRNIDIVAMKKGAGDDSKFRVVVGNPSKKDDPAIIKLTWDSKPSEWVLKQVRDYLRALRLEFGHLGRPRSAAIDSDDLPEGTEVNDTPGGKLGEVLLEATIPFKPEEYQVITVEFDVSSLGPGELAVIHGTHEDSSGQVIGGITWALLMT